jgi:hypothetical protein
MFSSNCAQFVIGKPLVAVEALLELRDLLKALRASPPGELASLKIMPLEGKHETSAEAQAPTAQSLAPGSAANPTSRRSRQRTRERVDGTVVTSSHQRKPDRR